MHASSAGELNWKMLSDFRTTGWFAISKKNNLQVCITVMKLHMISKLNPGNYCSEKVPESKGDLQRVTFFSSIGLFSLYILFSHSRPRDATRGNSVFQMSSYARANLRITNEKTKGKFPWGHHVVWNGKTKSTSWKGLFVIDNRVDSTFNEVWKSQLIYFCAYSLHSNELTIKLDLTDFEENRPKCSLHVNPPNSARLQQNFKHFSVAP